jgi:hypothetical protein
LSLVFSSTFFSTGFSSAFGGVLVSFEASLTGLADSYVFLSSSLKSPFFSLNSLLSTSAVAH